MLANGAQHGSVLAGRISFCFTRAVCEREVRKGPPIGSPLIPTSAGQRREAFESFVTDPGLRLRLSVAELRREVWLKVRSAFPKHISDDSIDAEISVLFDRLGIGARPRTLQEIASDRGVTRERVRQLEARALIHLRSLQPSALSVLRPYFEWLNYSDGLIFRDDAPRVVDWSIMALAREVSNPKEGIEILDEFCISNPWNAGALSRVFENAISSFWRGGIAGLETCMATAVPFHLDSIQYRRQVDRLVALVLARVPATKAERRSDVVQRALRTIGTAAHFSDIAQQVAKFENENPTNQFVHNVHAVLLRETEFFLRPGGRGLFSLREWGGRDATTLAEEMRLIMDGAQEWYDAAEIKRRLPAGSQYPESSIMLTACMNRDIFAISPTYMLFSIAGSVVSEYGFDVGIQVEKLLRECGNLSRAEIKTILKDIPGYRVDSVLCFDRRILGVGSPRSRRLVLYELGVPSNDRIFSTNDFIRKVQRDADLPNYYAAIRAIERSFQFSPRWQV